MKNFLVISLIFLFQLYGLAQRNCSSTYSVNKIFLKFGNPNLYKIRGIANAYRFQTKIQDAAPYFVAIPDTAQNDGTYFAFFQLDTNKIAVEITYKNSIKNGIEKIYNLSGFINSETSYKNGIKDGMMKIYDEDGKIKSEDLFSMGNCVISIRYYQEGKVSSISGSGLGYKSWDKKGRLSVYSETINGSYAMVTVVKWHLFSNREKEKTIEIGDTLITQSFYSNSNLKSMKKMIKISKDDCYYEYKQLENIIYWDRRGKELKRKIN